MAKKIRVFVYGTLKQGYGNHRLLNGSEFLGRATIAGRFKLVSLGGFPGVVKLDEKEDAEAGEREIGGEVYVVSNDVLSALDCLEGHPSFYCREKVMTSLGNRAWVYLLNREYRTRDEVQDLFWRPSDEEKEWINERRVA